MVFHKAQYKAAALPIFSFLYPEELCRIQNNSVISALM